MIISVHVPKCAGTSFRHVLDRLCGSRVWYNYGTVFSRSQARLDAVPAGTGIIHGHFIADAFDDLYPERTLITWVRHPVERLVSNYYHFLRSPDMRDDCCRILHENRLDLRQFSDLAWMKNETVRYLADKPAEDFGFIGVAERFDTSVRQFCRRFGFADSVPLPRENVNPDRVGERYTISEDDFAFILERNQADFAWYLKALELLEAPDLLAMTRIA